MTEPGPREYGAITGAESAVVSVCAFLAVPMIAAWLGDQAGLAIHPRLLLGLGVIAAVLTLAGTGRGARWAWSELAACLAAAGGVFAWLIWMAWPSLVPLGGGVDLTHHLVLVDYIERHWALVHGSPVGMGEMAAYTPGAHILIVLAGAWAGTDGFHATHTLLALTVALKVAFVLLITLRVLPDRVPRLPFGLAAVLLLFLPRVFFVGSFTEWSFLAQVVAELFAVVMWWALVVWGRPAAPRSALVVFAAASVAVFLAWPIWVAAPLLAFGLVAIARQDMAIARRLQLVACAAAPIAGAAVVHLAGRWGVMGIAQSGGLAVWPSAANLGWVFPLLAASGVAVLAFRRRGRPTAVFVAAIALEAALLYGAARARGAGTPYHALKMAYLAVYPLAVAGAVTLAEVWNWTAGFPERPAAAGAHARRIGSSLAWASTLIAAVLVARHLAATPRPKPVVSAGLYDAGRWARAHVPPGCVDYLVASESVAYWLHLAVMGNPRNDGNAELEARLVPRNAMARWIEPAGLPYAVADLPVVPNDIRSQVTVLAQFGTAAVLERRGPKHCSAGTP